MEQRLARVEEALRVGDAVEDLGGAVLGRGGGCFRGGIEAVLCCEDVDMGVGQEGGDWLVGGQLAACVVGVRCQPESICDVLLACSWCLLPLSNPLKPVPLPSMLVCLFSMVSVRLALGDVIVDGPPVLPVLLKGTGNLEDVCHCLRSESQPGVSSSDPVQPGLMLTVPSWTAFSIVALSSGQICWT